MKTVLIFLTLFLTTAALTTASAQTVVGDFAIAGGGGIVADASNRILFTIGQPAAGPVAGSPYAIHAGYLGADYIITGVVGQGPDIPTVFALHQNYPNPFNPSTTIQYDLPEGAIVTLKVYNLLGAEVATLVNREETAGYKSVVWQSPNVASGMYVYRVTAGTNVVAKKLMLIR